MTMVLVGRGIAGVGAAGLLTVSVLLFAVNKVLITGQIIRTILSDSSSLNTNNMQQSSMFFLYSIGFSIGPVAGGYLVTANFRWVFAIKYDISILPEDRC
jgi:MFS family permease